MTWPEPTKPNRVIGGKIKIETIKEIMCKIFGHKPKQIRNKYGYPQYICKRCKDPL